MILGALVGIAIPSLAGPLAQYQNRYSATIERLNGNLYLIQATGFNVAALVTDDGVVLVDTMPRGWWGPAVLAAIRSVTDKPITTIINTHSHQDHIGNAPVFSATMTSVLMQENTKFQIQHSEVAGAAKSTFQASTTFADTLSLTRGKDRIDLYYFGPGHTNGDAWVVFPSLRIMHIGDLAFKQDAPSFDRTAGGSGVAYPDTLARGLAATTEVDTIIVGHSRDGSSPVMSRRELEEYQRFAARLLSDTRAAQQARERASDTAARIGSLDAAAAFNPDRVRAAVEAIYDELMTSGAVRTTAGSSAPTGIRTDASSRR
jgi:glyoxylase-like metal-dependent hydrolase (beta-lactamase superfamily II)